MYLKKHSPNLLYSENCPFSLPLTPFSSVQGYSGRSHVSTLSPHVLLPQMCPRFGCQNQNWEPLSQESELELWNSGLSMTGLWEKADVKPKSCAKKKEQFCVKIEESSRQTMQQRQEEERDSPWFYKISHYSYNKFFSFFLNQVKQKLPRFPENKT